MTTSGAYDFNPGLGELVLNAFGRIGVLPPALTAQHMMHSRIEANLLQAAWSNKGVNLWAVDLQTVPLVQGTATYSVPPETVMILDTYISTTDGSVTTDRTITPMSRSDYAGMPNKAQQGSPTSFWFDRLLEPTITLWNVPDDNGPYTLKYYRYRMLQDAVLTGNGSVDVPVLWMDAFAAGLAHRLSRHYARDLEMQRKADAAEAWGVAAEQNVENVALHITPMLSSYYR